MCPCCCCYWRTAGETSALAGVVQPKRLGLAAYPISATRKRSSGLNRIGHPDWVKLCVELNCAPNQNTFCYKQNLWIVLISTAWFSFFLIHFLKPHYRMGFKLSMYIPNPSAARRMWDKVNFKRSIAGLNSEFSFKTGCLTETKETSLSYYLTVVTGRTDRFMPFLRQTA